MHLYATPLTKTSQCVQRWSPRGHGLGLEAPRGQLVTSLALALWAKSLALALASENMYLVLMLSDLVFLKCNKHI